MNMKVYRRIRDLRKAHGLTQVEMSNAVNVSQCSYSYYENGRRLIPLKVLWALADFYDVSMDYLLERTDKPETKW